MRRLCACLATLMLAATLPPVQATHGGVHISEILPSPESGQREFIELWNDGPDVDLAGWTVRDAAATPNVYTFGDVLLPSGGRIVVWGGGETDARGPAWSKTTVWNNDGDQAILRDAGNQTVDAMAYGNAGWPDGRTDPVPAAPSVGRSLALRDGTWVEASPTPGTVAAEQSGDVSATVEDVPPAAAFVDVPEAVEPGATFSITFQTTDGNGGADVVAWRLSGDGVLLENGTTAGSHSVSLGAPVDRDTWRLRIEAEDAAGQVGDATADVAIRSAGLAVVVPADGIRFPPFPPGAAEVLADTTFTMRNDAADAVVPRIDVSDLRGPADVALAGRLHIGYGEQPTQWTLYDGPLTELPALGAGEIVAVRLRLTDLPAPLPAGSYGTSFTVVQ